MGIAKVDLESMFRTIANAVPSESHSGFVEIGARTVNTVHNLLPRATSALSHFAQFVRRRGSGWRGSALGVASVERYTESRAFLDARRLGD